MIDGSVPDHKNPALQRYKNELKLKVDQEIGSAAKAPEPAKPVPVKKEKVASEEIKEEPSASKSK